MNKLTKYEKIEKSNSSPFNWAYLQPKMCRHLIFQYSFSIGFPIRLLVVDVAVVGGVKSTTSNI